MALARLAEDPGIILFSYLCALLPLAVIYALDFINEEWKTIRATRRAGKLHLALSLPPLAVVVFYIHLQRVAEDYKEMATAITAAILCIFHVLRTSWGLLQLRVFREWNMHALHVLTRIGFDVPMDEKKRPVVSETSSDLPNSDRINGSFNARIFKFFVSCGDSIRKALGLQHIPMFMKRIFFKFSRKARCSTHQAEIGAIIDEYMMVNSSLVDNEFSGAELPCRPNFSVLRRPFKLAGLSTADFLTCREPEECIIRWTVSFLSRFGSDWLINVRQLANLEKPTYGGEFLGDSDLPNRIAAFIAFTVTHKVEIERQDGTTSSEHVSLLSPIHELCSDLVEPWVLRLKVTEKSCLPYAVRDESTCRVLMFGKYGTNIRNMLSAWHKDSLNELEENEADSVLNMSPHQVACFCKLLAEQNSHMLSISKNGFSYMFRCGFKLFLWQLGYFSKPFELDHAAFEAIAKDFLGPMPVVNASLQPLSNDMSKKSDLAVLQASVHVDYWLALEAQHFPIASDEVQNEVQETESKVFRAQKLIELRRLQLQAAQRTGINVRTLRNIKFLGCVMETVRTSLAFWLHESPGAIESEGSDVVRRSQPSSATSSRGCDRCPVDWKPPISEEWLSVPCSDQLNASLQECLDNGSVSLQTSLQMRTLWEIQMALIGSRPQGPCSPSLMMLCLLGYPSLRISKTSKCPRVHPPSSQFQENNCCNVIVPIDSAGGEENHAQDGTVNSKYDDCESTNMCFKIENIEAPQPLHIIFQWNSEAKNANIRMCRKEGSEVPQFCWQSWKDGFMGRICAMSEWRLTRLHHENEMMRKEAAVSSVTEGISETDTETEHNTGIEGVPDSSTSGAAMTYWRGWPPFLCAITGFEKEVSSLHFEKPADLDGMLDRRLGARRPHIRDACPIYAEDDGCECGCMAHKQFIFAINLLEQGTHFEADALEYLRECIIDYMHPLALEHYVSAGMKNPSEKAKLVSDILSFMIDGVKKVSEKNNESNCRKFKCYELAKLRELLRTALDNSRENKALLYKASAMLLKSQDTECWDERCIEAFESLLMLEDAVPHVSEVSHFCLALLYVQRYCETEHESNKEIGIQHFMGLRHSYTLDIGLLIEKGRLSYREYGRLSELRNDIFALQPEGNTLDKMLKDICLWSSTMEYQISGNAKSALTIYSEYVPLTDKDAGLLTLTQRRAANRLGMMYHRGRDGISQDLAMAEALYTTAIGSDELFRERHAAQYNDVHRINSICNLAVLYGQRLDDLENAERSVQLLKLSIEEFEGGENIDEPLEKHSCSMNNLAVLMESGTLVQNGMGSAKKLYQRCIEIDENPIAMYNLGVLLKFGDPSPEGVEKAESLFAAVAGLGVDLQSMPVLDVHLSEAQTLSVTNVSSAARFEVEEIDDCLAYVKIVDSI